jgi:hypothetical protein
VTRRRRPALHEREREQEEGPRPAEPAPAVGGVLELQQRFGNRAVAGMLARKGPPPPTRAPIKPVENLDAAGTNADQWREHMEAGKDVDELYAEIARLLNATVIEDVAGTRPQDIHGALKEEGDRLKPGLNFVSRLEPPGRTGLLLGDKFGVPLPTERTGPLPHVAVLLGPKAFVAANKARTLAVLRHELEHAAHNQMAISWLKRWRADTKAANTPFRAWLAQQSIAPADLAIVRERIDGTDVNTEALAHLEGFMAGFAHESAEAAKGSRAAFFELDAAATHWVSSDKAVKDDFVARLREFRATLKGDRLAAFSATLQRLKRENSSASALLDRLG